MYEYDVINLRLFVYACFAGRRDQVRPYILHTRTLTYLHVANVNIWQ